MRHSTPFTGAAGAQARAPDGQEVAVKALSMRRAGGWKALELFEREARVLQGLSHPGIPRYIDYLTEDSDTDRGSFLVQAKGPQAAT